MRAGAREGGRWRQINCDDKKAHLSQDCEEKKKRDIDGDMRVAPPANRVSNANMYSVAHALTSHILVI